MGRQTDARSCSKGRHAARRGGASIRLTVLLVAILAFAGIASADEITDLQQQGLTLFRAGRYAEAVPILTKAVDLAEAARGADNPELAVDLNNLAEANRLAGNNKAAEELYLRAIELDQKARGPSSLGLATTLNNLALVYRAQDRLPDAERLYLRSLSMLEQSLGPSHPDVAKSLNNLAMLYRAGGQDEKARPLLERAIDIAGRALGARHPTTKTLSANLAALSGGKPVVADKPGRKPAKAAAVGPAAAAPVPKLRPEPGASAEVAPPAPSAPPRQTVASGGTEAAQPAARPAAGDGASDGPSAGIAIQLASVKDPDGAVQEWKTLVRRHPSLATLKLLPPRPVEVANKGTFYRVMAGSFPSRASADAACRPIREADGDCIVVGR